VPVRSRSPRSPRTWGSASHAYTGDSDVDVDAGRKDGLTNAERAELVALRRRTRVLEMENHILQAAARWGFR